MTAASAPGRSTMLDRGRRLRTYLTSPRTAAALAIATLLLLAAFVPLTIAARQMTAGGFWGQIIIALPLLAVGVVIARRQPRNPIGWLFLVMTLVFALGLDAGHTRSWSTGWATRFRSAR